MNVMDVIDLMKHYNIFDKAEAECRLKKLSTAPYDMQGHHKVYCSHLDKKWVETRNKKDATQDCKCKEWDNVSIKNKPAHKECKYVHYCITEYCKNNCIYYVEKIAVLEKEMEKIKGATETLIKAANKDSSLI